MLKKQNVYMQTLKGEAKKFNKYIKNENNVVSLESAQLKYFLDRDNEPRLIPKYAKSCQSDDQCQMLGPGDNKMDYGSCTQGSCNMTSDMSQGFSGAGAVRSTTSLNADFFRGDPLIKSPPLSVLMFRTADSYELNLFRPSKLLYSTGDE
jgi:hypothetical protein